MHYHPADTEGAPPQEEIYTGNEIIIASKRENAKIIIDEIEQKMQELGWLEDNVNIFITALSEALNNAIVHGNFGLAQAQFSDDEKYSDAIKEAEAKWGEVKKVIITIEDMSSTHISMMVTDEGKGFNHEALLDPRQPENLLKESGRGVLIMQKLVKVEYLGDGNKVRLELPRVAEETAR
ncbi:MAG: ATP-binding protein [Patescibacteria group bacterium]